MSNLFIGVKRIVAVDSSEFAYAELDIDKHSMLVAQGNVGKSSLINALRLFFLPECSMAHQANNFGFSDSNGDFYPSETTFNHYFPSKYSFLILEYEKRLYDGPTTCQIISASSGRLKFERMFTSLPYAQLQHLFWQDSDIPADSDDGIGERVDSLSKQKVYDFIHQHDKHALLVKDNTKAASVLYASELSETRYSLFPMRTSETQNIESLRALIKLLFVATSRNKKPFNDAIANIIEGNKKSTQDQLGFSIAEFKQRHESLKEEEAKLTSIINLQASYKKLLKQKQDFIAYLGALGQVRPAISWLEEGSANLRKRLQEHADKNAIENDKFEKAKKKLITLEDKLKLAKAQQKQHTKDLRHFTSIVNRAHQIEAEFSGADLSFIKTSLEADIADHQEQLAVIDGEVKRDEALAKIKVKIDAYEQEKQQIELALDNTQFDLDKQLDSKYLHILHSINPMLSSANTGQTLASEHKQHIEQFLRLFKEQSNDYKFFDQQITRKPFAHIDRNTQLNRLEQEIQALKKRQQQISQDSGNELHKQRNRNEIEKAITLSQNDLKVLADFEYAKRRVSDIEKDLAIIDDELEASEKLIDAAVHDKESKNIVKQRANADYLACQQEIEQNNAMLKALKEFVSVYQNWMSIVEDDPEFNAYIDQNQLTWLNNTAQNLAPLQFSICNSLRDFIDAQIIVDKYGVKGDSPFWHEINATIDELDAIYANLETQRHLLGKQIEEHNQTIGTKKEIIVQNYRVIKAFERDINQAFAGITINNVAEVEFTIGINRQFETLVQEFEHTNLFAKEMQSEEFYQRLIAFAERFFDSDDNFTITMDKVIESFEPRVQLQNKTSKEDKKQSNSTNALIKLKLVQLLLRRLLAHQAKTAFPIVHDEIANIDISQFDWWLNDLKQAGFNLIAAGTHSTSPELQAKIGRFHVLDALSSHKPYNKERARVYWRGAEEFVQLDEVAQQEELL